MNFYWNVICSSEYEAVRFNVHFAYSSKNYLLQILFFTGLANEKQRSLNLIEYLNS